MVGPTFLALIAAIAVLSSGCAVSRPCTDGEPPIAIKGDVLCYQKQMPDGRWLSHGRFTVFHPNGKPAIEGQYTEGKRTGIWSEFDETGKKTLERTFDSEGVEKR